MSRTATIAIEYVSNLEQKRAEMEAYLQWLADQAASLPSLNLGSAGLLPDVLLPRPVTTFGGLTSSVPVNRLPNADVLPALPGPTTAGQANAGPSNRDVLTRLLEAVSRLPGSPSAPPAERRPALPLNAAEAIDPGVAAVSASPQTTSPAIVDALRRAMSDVLRLTGIGPSARLPQPSTTAGPAPAVIRSIEPSEFNGPALLASQSPLTVRTHSENPDRDRPTPAITATRPVAPLAGDRPAIVGRPADTTVYPRPGVTYTPLPVGNPALPTTPPRPPTARLSQLPPPATLGVPAADAAPALPRPAIGQPARLPLTADVARQPARPIAPPADLPPQAGPQARLPVNPVPPVTPRPLALPAPASPSPARGPEPFVPAVAGVPVVSAAPTAPRPATAATLPSPVPATRTTPVSPLADLSHLPDYISETLRQRYAVAERAGVVPQIEALSYDRRLTATQIVPQLRGANLSAPADPEATPADVVRAVRTRLGIPSQDERTEFEAARTRYVAARDINVPSAPLPVRSPELSAPVTQNRVSQQPPSLRSAPADLPAASPAEAPQKPRSPSPAALPPVANADPLAGVAASARSAAESIAQLGAAARPAAEGLGEVAGAAQVAAGGAGQPPRTPPTVGPTTPGPDDESTHVNAPHYLSGYRTGDAKDRQDFIGRIRSADPAERFKLLDREAVDELDLRGDTTASEEDRRQAGRNAESLLREADRYAPGTSAARLAYHAPQANRTESPDVQARRLDLLRPDLRAAYVSRATAADAAVEAAQPGTDAHREALARQRVVRAESEYGVFGPQGGRRYYGTEHAEDLGPVAELPPRQPAPYRGQPQQLSIPSVQALRALPGGAGGGRVPPVPPASPASPGGPDDIIDAEFEPAVPRGAIVRTNAQQRGPAETSPGDAGTVFYQPPHTVPPQGTYGSYTRGSATGGSEFIGEGYGDPTGSYGTSRVGGSDGLIGPRLASGNFFSSRPGLVSRAVGRFRGGEGDPIQSALQTGARTHLLPRYLPRAYEAAGGAVGLAGGYLAFEGYRSIATDYLAQNDYENAETQNVSGDRGQHFQNQLALYDAQHNANPFSRLRDPFGTERAATVAAFSQAQLSEQNTSQFRANQHGVQSERISALSQSSNYSDRLASITLSAEEDRTSRNERFAGQREAAGQQAQYYTDQADDVRHNWHPWVTAADDKRITDLNRQGDTVRDRLDGQLNRQQKAEQAAADARTAAQIEKAQNDRTASLTEITGETAASRLQFGNSRAAAIQRIRNPYDAAKIQAGRDIKLYGQLDAQEGAALVAENDQYGRETDFLTAQTGIGRLQTNVGVLSAGHYDYAAQQQDFQAQAAQAQLTYRQQTAGLDAADPEQAQRIKDYGDQLADALRGVAAAAKGAKADFEAQQVLFGRQTNAQALGLSGRTREAADESTNAEYDEQERLHPELKSEYEQRRQVTLAGNALTDERQQFSIGLQTTGLFQSARQNELRQQGLGRTADVQGQTDSGVAEILQAKADPYLQAHPELLQQRIQGIEAERGSATRNLTDQVGLGGRAAVVGQYVSRPGQQNIRQFRDLETARTTAANQAAAFASAERGKLPDYVSAQRLAGRAYAATSSGPNAAEGKSADQSVAQLKNTVDAMYKQMDQITKYLKKANGS